jgi:GDP-4-dehydro-6-deoxy-D-mannose reductase
MKVLLFGASGFIGRIIYNNLSVDHEVHATTRLGEVSDLEHNVDLLDVASIGRIIKIVQPDIVINAAGIINLDADVTENFIFTKNILKSIVETNVNPKSVIICGSASEYGNILENELPVNENVPLRAVTGYGLAKKIEELAALEYRKKGVPVIVVRIFNPIGPGMAEKFLVPRLKKQLNEYLAGDRASLQLSRKDSNRDYISVGDIAAAIRVLIEGKPVHSVYNIGSGIAMSNGNLLQLMINSSKIKDVPVITETSNEPERLIASQADITRIQQEFNWKPEHTIADTVEEIMND